MKIELGVKRQKYDRDDDITIQSVDFPGVTIYNADALNLLKGLGKKGTAVIEYEVEGVNLDEQFGNSIRLKIISIDPASKKPFIDNRSAEEALNDYMENQ